MTRQVVGSRVARMGTIAAVMMVLACTHSRTETAARADRNVITKEQLAKSHFSSVYDAVASLRGNWLQTRGTDSFQSPTQVKVYFDNTMYGGVDSMRNIPASTISFIRYFDGVAATARWGLDHGAGVIYVSTRPAAVTDP